LKGGSVVLKIKPPADLTYFEQYVVCVCVSERERQIEQYVVCVQGGKRRKGGGKEYWRGS